MRATSALFLTFAFALLLFLISFMGQNDLALPTEASSPITDRYSVLATRKMFQQPNFNMSNFIPSFKKLTYNPLPLHRVNEDSSELESGNKNVTTGTTQSLLSCQESFPPKCDIYPYVKFWNQRFLEEDCYYSPLRHPLGKKAPASETKYLVFQSDGGGWNNIRMAAETAMVFAHATGRYFECWINLCRICLTFSIWVSAAL